MRQDGGLKGITTHAYHQHSMNLLKNFITLTLIGLQEMSSNGQVKTIKEKNKIEEDVKNKELNSFDNGVS